MSVREAWRVPSDGRIKTIVTSASTVQTMDEAVRVYDRILARLAVDQEPLGNEFAEAIFDNIEELYVK